jgi:succinoglycan biosynthesis transport protein ExoP
LKLKEYKMTMYGLSRAQGKQPAEPLDNARKAPTSIAPEMMTTPTNSEDAPRRGELERILLTLRRHKLLIIACFSVAAIFAVGVSLAQQKQYTATASLLFRDPGFAQGVLGANATSTVQADPNRQAATNLELVGLDTVSARTAERVGDSITADEVSEKVAVETKGQSDVISVSASDAEPERAQHIANSFANEFIAFRAEADKSKLLSAKRLAERQLARLSPEEEIGPRGEQLSRGAERLGILASLQTGNAELVQPASVPESPSSPKPVRNGIVGGILGLMIGIGLAFLFERLNRRLRDPADAGDAFDLPVLGTVPESKVINEAAISLNASTLPFSEEESFRMLRASLRYFSVDHEIRTLLVTSSTAQAGKSTVSWSLARVAAKTARVVLLETDLRNPTLAKTCPDLAGPGLTQVLTHQTTLDKAIRNLGLDGEIQDGNGGGPGLNVITAGSVPPNPAELLESQGMADVISQLAERFDFVVIDTAPIGVVSDSFPLMSKVDGAIIVARMEKTTRDSAIDLRDQLKRLGAPVLGVVANGVKVGRRGTYGYGYYGQPPETESRESMSSSEAK